MAIRKTIDTIIGTFCIEGNIGSFIWAAISFLWPNMWVLELIETKNCSGIRSLSRVYQDVETKARRSRRGHRLAKEPQIGRGERCHERIYG